MAKVQPRTGKAASARPGTADQKGKKEKKIRVDHPALFSKTEKDDKGNPKRIQLEEVPADFDSKLHKPLKKNDFAKESTFLRLRADEYEAKAVALRKEAETADKLGNKADRQKVKKLAAMKAKMAELMKELESAGIDVDDE